ncbi:MAG: hypothetical protein AAF533_16060 [Acidobacteriota bacterium]
MSTTTLHATAPCRVDLAGGTLDLWPLSQLVTEAVTVNLAVGLRAGCELVDRDDGSWVFEDPDGGSRLELPELPARPERELPPQFTLAGVVAAHFELGPMTCRTWSEAPRHSGLGGSSALVMALIAAAARRRGRELTPTEAVGIACNLETRVLGKPAGTQDHWSAWCGGLSVLEHGIEGTVRRGLPPVGLELLGRALVVVDSTVTHHSGMNNWSVFQARVDDREPTTSALEAIAAAARELRERFSDPKLTEDDLPALGHAIDTEWSSRRRLSDAVSCDEIERLIGAAREAGGWAKVCGAGGGGCLIALPPKVEARAELVAALEGAGGRVLDAAPEAEGVLVQDGRAAAASGGVS